MFSQLRGMGFDLSEVIKQAGSVLGMGQKMPQTQADIRQIAQAAQTAQSPAFQAQLQRVEAEVADYAKVQLALQAFSTMAIIGLFLIALRNHSKGKS